MAKGMCALKVRSGEKWLEFAVEASALYRTVSLRLQGTSGEGAIALSQ